MNNAIRRPINYYGSKERLCPRIHALVPPDVDTWVDVFCGSAVVTLTKPRHKRETINDLNGDVVNLFDVLRDQVRAAELYRRVELTPYAEELLHRVYEAEPTEDAVERAWRFLITSWFGRGGDAHRTGFRWSKGQNTSPERTWAELPKRLAPVADRLRGICVRSDDAMKIIADYNEPNCLLFCDPPYPGDVGRRYAVKMTADNHLRFAQALAGAKARVILTMNPDTIYDQVLAGWVRLNVDVTGGRARTKGELIYCNFEPSPLLAMAAE